MSEQSDEDEDLLVFNLFEEPSLSNRLQIGFACSDQFTQTFNHEIMDIKQISLSVSDLQEEIKKARNDLIFIEKSFRSVYEEQIEVIAYHLQTRLIQKMQELQKMYEERVFTVRRSCKQQLQDSLVKISAYYKKYYNSQVMKISKRNEQAKEIENKTCGETLLKSELEKLKEELKERKGEVKELNQQIMKLSSNSQPIQFSFEDDMLQQRNQFLENELNDTVEKIQNMHDELMLKESNIKVLQKDLTQSQMQLRKMQGELDKVLVKQKKETEKTSKKENKIIQVSGLDKSDERSPKEVESQMITLMKRKHEQEEQESKEKLEDIERKTANILSNKDKEIEDLRNQLLDLKRKENEKLMEVERTVATREQIKFINMNQSWEKKFEILRASLHAIKDESYLRGQLHKQAMNMKYATVSYDDDNFSAHLDEFRHLERNDQWSAQKIATPRFDKDPKQEDQDEADDNDEDVMDFLPLPNFGSFMSPPSPQI